MFVTVTTRVFKCGHARFHYMWKRNNAIQTMIWHELEEDRGIDERTAKTNFWQGCAKLFHEIHPGIGKSVY